MDLKLSQLNIQGFKSFGKEQNIRFGDITIFIGANGSGKSNLVSFFEMLNYMMDEGLDAYVGQNGGAIFFTHLGSNHSISCELIFQSDTNQYRYEFRLAPTNFNKFYFTAQKASNKELGDKMPTVSVDLNNLKESALFTYKTKETKDYVETEQILNTLKKIKPFQFHNTSSNAEIRQSRYVNNTGYLMNNGGNLAAFLYGLYRRSEFIRYYERIVRNIKLAYPSFKDFVLKPDFTYPDNIRLDWRDESSPPNFRFSPQQLSDGTLRFMALATLLLQPPETIPKVIVIDEPELGLHPTAISILSNMIYTASKYSQIVLATQSAQLLDYFEPEHIRIVEREGSNSIVTEPDKEQLEYWLKDYSLGQIWEKNIIGGRP